MSGLSVEKAWVDSGGRLTLSSRTSNPPGSWPGLQGGGHNRG